MGCPSLMPRSRGISSPSGTKLPHRKLETLGYHTVKTQSLYLTCAWYTTGLWQTDRRTDRQTDRIPIANTRSQQYLPVQLSRVKTASHFSCTFSSMFNHYLRLWLIVRHNLHFWTKIWKDYTPQEGGTGTGPLNTPPYPHPPSGRRFHVTSCCRCFRCRLLLIAGATQFMGWLAARLISMLMICMGATAVYKMLWDSLGMLDCGFYPIDHR